MAKRLRARLCRCCDARLSTFGFGIDHRRQGATRHASEGARCLGVPRWKWSEVESLIDRSDSVETDAIHGAPQCMNRCTRSAMARPRKPLLTLPPHVHRVVSRGREYFTFQKGAAPSTPGPASSFPIPADPEFFPAYYAIAKEEPPTASPGSFDALIAAWQASPEWRALAPKTSIEWSRYIGRISSAWGNLRVAALEPKHVLALRDKYASTPAAAEQPDTMPLVYAELVGSARLASRQSLRPCQETQGRRTLRAMVCGKRSRCCAKQHHPRSGG